MDGLARRWNVPPSAVLAQDAGVVMGILALEVEELPPEPTEDERRLTLLAGAMTVGE